MSAVFLAAWSLLAVLVAGDQRAIVEFQRAADAYAFLHRQVERRLGLPHQRTPFDATGLAAAMVGERTRTALPPLFTADVVAEFRSLAARALSGGCDAGELRSGAWELSHAVNSPATGSTPLTACLTFVLPRLPQELEYRSAGTVLLVVDTHANLVVDVLPALLAGSSLR